VHVEADAVAGAVREAGCRIAGAETAAVDDPRAAMSISSQRLPGLAAAKPAACAAFSRFQTSRWRRVGSPKT